MMTNSDLKQFEEEINGHAHILSDLFQNRVLPFHWLAKAELPLSTGKARGYGFDSNRRVAALKAHSECVERAVFSFWQATGVSPFSGCVELPPRYSTGFAAHGVQSGAIRRAFLEWLERHLIFEFVSGRIHMSPVSDHKVGFISRAALEFNGGKMMALVSRDSPFFSFTGYELPDGEGVLFGSSCRDDRQEAVMSSWTECVRKFSFVQQWRKMIAQGERSSFLDAIGFWLSSAGRNYLIQKIKIATEVAHENAVSGAYHLSDEFLRMRKFGERWVSFYENPEFELAIPYHQSFPLV